MYKFGLVYIIYQVIMVIYLVLFAKSDKFVTDLC